MRILHAFWLPDAGEAFVQSGSFHLWVETLERRSAAAGPQAPTHPFQLKRAAWPSLQAELGLAPAAPRRYPELQACTIRLPSAEGAPLPSPQLARYWPREIDEEQATVRPWQVDCMRLEHPVKQLSDIHFLAAFRAAEVESGSDFLFWYWFTQELKRLLARESPMLSASRPPPPIGTSSAPN